METNPDDDITSSQPYTRIPRLTGTAWGRLIYRILTCGDRPTEALHPSVYTQLRDNYGRIVRVPVPIRPDYIVLSDPELVERVLETESDRYEKYDQQVQELTRIFGQGLVTSDGSRWRRHKRVLSPMFTAQRVEDFDGLVSRVSARVLSDVEDKNHPVDITDVTLELVLEILGKAIFGSQFSTIREEVIEGLSLIGQAFPRVASEIPTPTWIPAKHHRQLSKGEARLDDAMERVVASSQNNDDGPTRFLDSLVANPELSQQEVQDELKTLLIAGLVTRTALTWVMYLLARHPSIQAELAAELQEAEAISFASVTTDEGSTLLERVIRESLRLCPPLPPAVRTPTSTVELGGYIVPPGVRLVLTQVQIHRDPVHWDAPLAFRPSRFMDGWRESRPAYSYYPFGGGKRKCIGRRFAYVILQGVLRHCFENYELVDAADVPTEQLTPAHPTGLELEVMSR